MRTLRPIAASNSRSSTGACGSRSRAMPDLFRNRGTSLMPRLSQQSWLAHLSGADIRIRRPKRIVLSEPGQPEIGRGDAGIGAAALDDEVGDQTAHRRRDLETVTAEARRDEQAVERGRADHRVPVGRDVVTSRITG